MEETKFVRVTHGDEAHFVALYTGLNPGEVSRLLQAAFKLPQHVVGLMDKAGNAEPEHEHGVVVPLSLACRAPQMLGDRTYSLLLSDKEVPWERAKTVKAFASTTNMRPNLSQGSPIALEWQMTSSAGLRQEQTKSVPAETPRAGAVGDGKVRPKPAVRTLWEAEDEEDQEEQGEDEVDDKERIVAFIRRMASNGLLTRDDQDALEGSAIAGDAVINAAFAVALHSQDLDYLSALFKDIATNRRDNPQGMRLLEAKREMLDMVEVLQQADEVDDDQLLYLQNLILVSDESVTDAFGVYEEDQDPVRLAESLKQLCGAEAQSGNTGPPGGAIANPYGGVGDGEDAGDENDENSLRTEAERIAMKATVLKVAINLTNEGLLGARDAGAVNDMIQRQNPVLVAAFKLFQEDGNAAELYDTVARAARFEAKRIAEASPAAGAQGEGEAAPGNAGWAGAASAGLPETDALKVAVAAAGRARGLEAKEKEKGSQSKTGAAERGISEDSDGHGHGHADGHADGYADGHANGHEHGHADGRGMDAAKALAGFQRLVTVAVQKGMMGMSDARVICAAFESGLGGEAGRLQELVHAAWGVFSTGGGEEDALDSLVRIVRLAVQPFQPTSPATAAAARGVTAATVRGASASPSTAELRESMSLAVSAIATQSAQLLLQSDKVSAEEASCLASPSPAGCKAILKALEVFEENSNKDVLLNAFAGIAKAELSKKRGGNGKAQGQGQQQDQEEGAEDADEDDDDDNDDDDDHDDDDDDDQDVDNGPIAAGREDADDGQEPSHQATVELLELADCMAGDKRIGGEEQRLLAALIENKHPGIMIAYNNYAATQDVSSLVSALMTIVRNQSAGVSGDAAAVSAPAAATSQTNDQHEGEGEGGGGPGDENDGDGEGEGNPLSREKQEKQNGRERVVLLMHETRVLTAADATRVLLLLAREDPSTLAAFEAFDASKDVSSLVESIKSILDEAPPIAPADLTMALDPDGDRSYSSPLLRQILQPLPDTEAGEEGDVGDEGDGGDGNSDPHGGGSPKAGASPKAGGSPKAGDDDNDDAVAERVVSIVDGMGLDENEAAALRLAIAGGDANIRGALELFRLDPDAEELKDTIARVARLVLEREREAGVAMQVPVAGASGAMNGGAGETVNVAAAADTGAVVETRPIDFTLDGKEGLFQELLQQMGCVGVMSEAQAAVIMDRYRNKDAVVFAALDVYKNENDMSELVDTLKRLT